MILPATDESPFAGDSRVEYPEEDYEDGPEEPEPFDLDKVNR
jgi:hypothetical protein